jgi:DNA processing protein
MPHSEAPGRGGPSPGPSVPGTPGLGTPDSGSPGALGRSPSDSRRRRTDTALRAYYATTAQATRRILTDLPQTGEGVSWDERLARAALTRIADPGDKVIGRALHELGVEGTLRAAHAGTPLPGAGPQRTESYALRAARADPLADLDAAQRAGARLVCPGDPDWPGQLDDLGAESPYALWVRGTPALRLWALRSVALVGARACTDYGAHMAALLAAGLADAGWVVVSGAAYGIDGAAHRSALRAGGATVGIVASGVDVPYPRGNAGLIADIADRGLLLGELPPGSHPSRSRFILRNRVIAALTRGTVVVEARYRSGSLITARRAAALGRITMGVPGPCTSGMSEGVHELLRGDALMVTDAADIIELVGEIGADLAPPRRGPVLPHDRLAPAAARILEAIPGHGDATEEAIAEAAGTGVADTLGRLHELQALGFVERSGGRWALVRTAREAPQGGSG